MRWKQTGKELGLLAVVALLGHFTSSLVSLQNGNKQLPFIVNKQSEAPPFTAKRDEDIRSYLARYLANASSTQCKAWAQQLLYNDNVDIPRFALGSNPMNLSDPWVVLLHRWTKIDPAAADAFCISTEKSSLINFALYLRAYHDPKYRDFTLPDEQQHAVLSALLQHHPSVGLALYKEAYNPTEALEDLVREAIIRLVGTNPNEAIRWDKTLDMWADEEIVEAWCESDPRSCLEWLLKIENPDDQCYLFGRFTNHNETTAALFLSVAGLLPKNQELDELIIDAFSSVTDPSMVQSTIEDIKKQFANDPILKNRYLRYLLYYMSDDQPYLAFDLVCEMANDRLPVIQLGIKTESGVNEFKDVNWNENGPPDRIVEDSYSIYRLLEGFLAADPKSIQTYLARLPPNAISMEDMSRLYREWMVVDTDAAINYFIKNSESLESKFLQYLEPEKYLLPQEHEVFLAKLPPGLMRDASMANRVENLSMVNWLEAWKLTNDYEGDRTLALESLISTITPDEVAYIPMLLNMLPEADENLWQLLTDNTGANPVDFLSEIPSGPLKDAGLIQQLENMPDLAEQHAEAIALATSIQTPALRDQSLETIYRTFRADLKQFYDPASRENFLLELSNAGISGTAYEQWKIRMEDDSR